MTSVSTTSKLCRLTFVLAHLLVAIFVLAMMLSGFNGMEDAVESEDVSCEVTDGYEISGVTIPKQLSLVCFTFLAGGLLQLPVFQHVPVI
mmetsp:Transcript_32191/g.77117  ORF Transcript_32191/g.77117 Transcript_32191/m.77117 type:complete len:90 (-) Transcript_32191:41-310(-)